MTDKLRAAYLNASGNIYVLPIPLPSALTVEVFENGVVIQRRAYVLSEVKE